VCFGGDDGKDLYITATTSLYRIRTNVRQAPRPGR
jgi:gluconolactonase